MNAVVIDDLEFSVARMSPLGRQIFEPLLGMTIGLLTEEITWRGWTVVQYEPFVNWVGAADTGGDFHLIVDRLFPARSNGDALFIDLHRTLLVNSEFPQLILDDRAKWEDIRSSRPILMVDDAAYTGMTLSHAVHALREHGLTVRIIRLLAVREAAALKLRALGPEVWWMQTVPSGYDILHLRDFIPWLPFSGRHLAARPQLNLSESSHLPYRLAPALYEQGAWLHLTADRMARCLAEINWSFVNTLEKHLRRTATVADLALLGDGVGIPLTYTNQTATAMTPLHSLLQLGR